jgi:L-alanine-DL-glutamate epimerase-like enolase superfamily enzyme
VKITQVDVSVLRVPVEHPYTAGGRAVDANWHVLARITTSDGVEGVGYIVYPRPDLMTAIGHAARELGEHLIGMSVLEPEAAWDRLARRGDWVGPGGLLHCALAPLDIAVWDAAGKTLGQPLHRMLGGYRDRLPTYASDGLWVSLSPAELAASAKRHVESGFRAVKLRLGKEATAEAEARRVHAVREAIGPDARIMVDAVESWSLARVESFKMPGSPGWRTRFIISTSPVWPRFGASSRSRSRPASTSITWTPSGSSWRLRPSTW